VHPYVVSTTLKIRTKPTISQVCTEILANGIDSHLYRDLHIHTKVLFSLDYDELLLILELPKSVIASADHMRPRELLYGLVYESNNEEAGIWLNEKLASPSNAPWTLGVSFEYLIHEIVKRRSEFDDISLDEAYIGLIVKEFSADPVKFVERIGYRPARGDPALEHYCIAFHADLVQYCRQCGYKGLDEYQTMVKPMLERLRYVSDETEEIWTMSSNGTLTIAYLYNYLYKSGYFSLPMKEKKNVIRACINPEKHCVYAWFNAMFLPRKLAMEANHQWAEELILSKGEKKRALVEWLCSKLHDYVRVYDGMYASSIPQCLPLSIQQCAQYDSVSLNDAIIDIHFRPNAGYWAEDKRQNDIFTLHELQTYYEAFQKEFLLEARRQSELGETSLSPRYEMLRYYVERFEEEIKRRKSILAPFTLVERLHMDTISENNGSMEIDKKAHAKFNNCVIIKVGNEKRFLPESSLRSLRTLLRPFSIDEHSLVISFEGKVRCITDREAFEQLFNFTSGEVGTCGICLDEGSSVGCGNRCTWRTCAGCFHEWYIKKPVCPMCSREYIPLMDRPTQ
jgi:hypothetical protein